MFDAFITYFDGEDMEICYEGHQFWCKWFGDCWAVVSRGTYS